MHEAHYADPVVRFQDPLFATSDREILVEKVRTNQSTEKHRRSAHVSAVIADWGVLAG